MSGLAHYLEDEGLATTLIALIRPHAEKIKPPRALWVPFELGRPFGAPGEPDFQRRVLVSVLGLLEAGRGPVLEDFPDDAPKAGDMTGWACPVNLPPPVSVESGSDRLAALEAEIALLAPWHERARADRGRTTVGASGLEIGDIARLLVSVLEDEDPRTPRSDLSLVETLKLATEDLKAFYFEAATIRPGGSGSRQVADWFWGETEAGRAFLALRPLCLASDDEMMRLFGDFLLVPESQMHRVE